MHSTGLFQRKTLYINLYITEFSLKLGGGGQIHYCPPAPLPLWRTTEVVGWVTNDYDLLEIIILNTIILIKCLILVIYLT